VADKLEFDTLLDRHTEAQLTVLSSERSHERTNIPDRLRKGESLAVAT
jgi:hypothetical protein